MAGMLTPGKGGYGYEPLTLEDRLKQLTARIEKLEKKIKDADDTDRPAS